MSCTYIIHRPAFPTFLSSEEARQFQMELNSDETGKMFPLKSFAIYIAILFYAPIGAPVETGNYRKMPGIMILWPNTKVLCVLVEYYSLRYLKFFFQGLREPTTSGATHQGGTTKEHLELEQHL